MNLLTPDLGLVFWMVLAFGIVFLLLAKFGFPVITGAVRQRQEYIATSIRSADEANQRLAGIQAEGDQILAQARSRQQDIIAGAMAERQQIVNSAKTEATEAAHKIAEESARSIELAKENALKDVQNQVAELALSIAERIVCEKMSDNEIQQKKISQILDNI